MHYHPEPEEAKGSDLVDEEGQFYLDLVKYLQNPHDPSLQAKHSVLRDVSNSYSLIDGVLHHGIRQPKRVLIQPSERWQVLNLTHVDSSGGHLSSGQMSSKIMSQFFWKSIHADAIRTVQECRVCPIPVDMSATLRPWTKVEVLLHGPFQNCCGEMKYIVSIQEVSSKFLLSKVVDTFRFNVDELGCHVAGFVFRSFCQFGFPNCSFLSENSDLFRSFAKQFCSLVQKGDLGLDPENLLSSVNTYSSNALYLKQIITEYTHAFVDWDERLDAWLFKYQTSVQDGGVPFQMMFGGREPCPNQSDLTSPIQSDENNLIKQRRTLKKSMLTCRHCEEVFTSRISFRLHQKHHIEDAKKRGAVEGEGGGPPRHSKKRPSRTRKLPNTVPENSAAKKIPHKVTAGPQLKEVEAMTESTVSAVKALLAATKDERMKRGKYFKYSQELRQEIVNYALEHGNIEAVNYFSAKLNNPIAESTIRNFVRASHKDMSLEVCQEIGKFAIQFGIEACLTHFKDKYELSRATVKRLKSDYAKNRPNTETADEGDGSSNVRKPKQIYNSNLRNEIGRYAFHCGNAGAVSFFSDKLQISVKESTVRKFKKAWMQRNDITQGIFVPEMPNEMITVQMSNDGSSSLEFINQNFEDQQQSQNGTCLVNPEVMTGNYQSMSNQFDPLQPLPLTMNSSHLLPSCSGTNTGSITTSGKHQVKQGQQPVLKPVRRVVQPEKTKKSSSKAFKRGQYASYDPMLRAGIAKYASNHSNQETILHFRKLAGIQLPESTVRGLRTKYQQKIEGGLVDPNDEVNELDHQKRGRRMRLGKYDPVVRGCIEKLVSSGEKVSYFMAIATAKQVLMQNDPGLLYENGGEIKLNPAWAKSFLKRMGIKNKE